MPAATNYIGQVQVGATTVAIGSTLFGSSSTSASSTDKIASVPGFTTLMTGITVHIRLIHGNSVTTSPTLQINETTALPIEGNFVCDDDSVVAFTLDDPNGNGIGKVWRVNQTGFSDTIKNYIDNSVANSVTPDALIFKGTIGTGGTPGVLPTTYEIGWSYRVITQGTYAGNACEVGDFIVAIADNDVAANADNTHWLVIQGNLDGTVFGPASSTTSHVVVFSDTTGKSISDSGLTIGRSVPANAAFTDTTYTPSSSNVYSGCSASNDSNATMIASVSNGVLSLSGLTFTTTNVITGLTSSVAGS